MTSNMNLSPCQIIISIDTREPPSGQGWEPHFSHPTVRETISTGDFSLPGCHDWIAVERKTASDLIACLTTSRKRFTEELRRAQRIREFYVVAELSYDDLLKGRFRSAMNPKSAWESVIALQHRYGIPFLLTGSPEASARLCESILIRWHKDHAKALDEIRKASRKFLRSA